MAQDIPDTSTQVEARMKVDVQRTAPDSNPYLSVHWLRSLIAGIALRIFDVYGDIEQAERRLFPDTNDPESADKWGGILIGPRNGASAALGTLVALGNPGGAIPIGTKVVAGETIYSTTTNATIAVQVVPVESINRLGAQVTVVTDVEHELSSFVPVTIAGADQTEYNVTDQEIAVVDAFTFTFTLTTTPVTPATGTITVSSTSATMDILSDTTGSITNATADTAFTLQSPIVDVDDTLYAITGGVAGGSDEETTAEYVDRYLERFQNPVALFNEGAIIQAAKAVEGVTRVFVQRAGSITNIIAVDSLTRTDNVAKIVVNAGHGLASGQTITVAGADQNDYNLSDARILVESPTELHYIVFGSPATPATGGITLGASLAPGQVKTLFLRDNDTPSPIPDAPEVAAVKAAIDTIVPLPTPLVDNIVQAPTPLTIDFTFTFLEPNTATMRDAVAANLDMFFKNFVTVGQSISEDVYRALITSTVDPNTGQSVNSFDLSTPVGDISVNIDEFPLLGTVTI